jgi:hypothetical protein
MKFQTHDKNGIKEVHFEPEDDDDDDAGSSSRRGGFPLQVGETYECTIHQVKYELVLTNIEFKDRRFFSISVDFYQNDALYKPNVYMYDPKRLQERTTRFLLNKDTERNHHQFWSTLRPVEMGQHHTEVSFLRDVIQQGAASKVCMYQVALLLQENKDLLATLDKLKSGITYPYFKVVPSEDFKELDVYSIQKNRPMRRVVHAKVGERLSNGTKIDGIASTEVILSDDNGKKSTVPFTEMSFWSTIGSSSPSSKKSKH